MNDTEPLRRFADIVHADPALQAELRQAGDQDAFVALVVARAGERGLAITAEAIAAALEAAKRAWTTQWLIR